MGHEGAPQNRPTRIRDGVAANVSADVTMRPRDERLDALKGVAILLVVLSHALQHRAVGVPPLLGVVSSVSMPLFAYLSGIAAGYSRERPFWERVRHKATSLLVPYLAWGCIYLLLYGLPSAESSGPVWIRCVSVVAQGPWYLAALFIFDLAVYPVRARTGRLVRFLPAVVMVFTAYGLSRVSCFGGWLLWPNMAKLLPLFVVGYLMSVDSRWKQSAARVRSPILICVYVVALVVLWPAWAGSRLLALLAANGVADSAWEPVTTLVEYVFTFSAGLSAAVVIERVLRHAGPSHFIEALRRIGSYSLGIYVMHPIVIRAWDGKGLTAVIGSFVVASAASLLVSVLLAQSRPLRTLLLGGR
ncbi:MAG: acyltransferase [Actinobacteria bacterium]|nr:MAG: acyltransferase [Actinomycetota bacterium]